MAQKYPARAHALKLIHELVKLIPDHERGKVGSPFCFDNLCLSFRLLHGYWLTLRIHSYMGSFCRDLLLSSETIPTMNIPFVGDFFCSSCRHSTQRLPGRPRSQLQLSFWNHPPQMLSRCILLSPFHAFFVFSDRAPSFHPGS